MMKKKAAIVIASVLSTACIAVTAVPATVSAAPTAVPVGTAIDNCSYELGWETVTVFNPSTQEFGSFDSYQEYLEEAEAGCLIISRSTYYNPNHLYVSNEQSAQLGMGSYPYEEEQDFLVISRSSALKEKWVNLVGKERAEDIIYNYSTTDPYAAVYEAELMNYIAAYVNLVYSRYPSLKGAFDVSPAEIKAQIREGKLEDKGIPFYSFPGKSLETSYSDVDLPIWTAIENQPDTPGAVDPDSTTTAASSQASDDLQQAILYLSEHPATVYNGTDYSNEFDAAYYYAVNPDLQTAIGADANALLKHYVECGKAEGRIAISQ